MAGVLKALEDTLTEAQRMDTKAQSALDLKKQNLEDETKKRKELVKNMEEVKYMHIVTSVGVFLCISSVSIMYWVYIAHNCLQWLTATIQPCFSISSSRLLGVAKVYQVEQCCWGNVRIYINTFGNALILPKT